MRLVPTRTLRRLTRPATALALVLAHAVATFGFPLVNFRTGSRGAACGGGACGCDSVCGLSDGCCCRVPVLAPVEPPPPPPIPAASCSKCGGPPESCCCTEPPDEPASPKCPRCRDREAAAPSTCPITNADTPPAKPVVTWVPAWKTRQCRGEGPQGLLAELPAVPPGEPTRFVVAPVPGGRLRVADLSLSSRTSVPLDPPPRRG